MHLDPFAEEKLTANLILICLRLLMVLTIDLTQLYTPFIHTNGLQDYGKKVIHLHGILHLKQRLFLLQTARIL